MWRLKYVNLQLLEALPPRLFAVTSNVVKSIFYLSIFGIMERAFIFDIFTALNFSHVHAF